MKMYFSVILYTGNVLENNFPCNLLLVFPHCFNDTPLKPDAESDPALKRLLPRSLTFYLKMLPLVTFIFYYAALPGN